MKKAHLFVERKNYDQEGNIVGHKLGDKRGDKLGNELGDKSGQSREQK
jgi:hypothetical protein